MNQRLQVAASIVLVAAVVWFSAGSGLADHYKNITRSHVYSGVSQLNYLDIPGGPCTFDETTGDLVGCEGFDLTLMNPVHDTQVVATLVYTNSRTASRTEFPAPDDPNAGQGAEVFLGCRVDRLTPHASIAIDWSQIPGAGEVGVLQRVVPDRYAEVIWAPLTPVPVPVAGSGIGFRRLANGLGGRALATGNRVLSSSSGQTDTGDLAHPKMFSLPDNAVVPGQEIAALICVCGAVLHQGLDPNTFKPFGLGCDPMPNEPPVADAGPNQTANHVQTVALDASGSSDPEGGVLTYAWSLGGSQIATGPEPTVGPFPVGSHTIKLTVTDEQGASAADSMAVTVINEPPVADAGPNFTITFKKGKTAPFTLDGSASYDPEGGVLSYLWTEAGQMVGTGAVVQVQKAKGVYTFALSVTDDHGAVSSDIVVVTIVKSHDS